jgi:hypothetical protein
LIFLFNFALQFKLIWSIKIKKKNIKEIKVMAHVKVMTYDFRLNLIEEMRMKKNRNELIC